MDELKVFTGNAHPALAKEITNYLDIPLGRAEVFEFSNENIFVAFWRMSAKEMFLSFSHYPIPSARA